MYQVVATVDGREKVLAEVKTVNEASQITQFYRLNGYNASYRAVLRRVA